MARVDFRERAGLLFGLLTIVHVALISTQVGPLRGMPLIETVVFGTFAEVQRGTTAVIGTVRDAWGSYVALRYVREENAGLRDEVGRLRVTLQQERAIAAQARTLQTLLDLRRSVPYPTTAATLIGGSASPGFRTVSIDKGTGDGLQQDLAVIAQAGVVGRIILPTPRASKVQLLIDRNAAAGVLIERSRVQGIVVGTGTDRLRMDYLATAADLRPGDRVVTSGIDGIYPKGLVVGQIESFDSEAGGYRNVIVEPAVEFSALEAVLVVLTPPGTAE